MMRAHPTTGIAKDGTPPLFGLFETGYAVAVVRGP
jgi:hypothetical protein